MIFTKFDTGKLYWHFSAYFNFCWSRILSDNSEDVSDKESKVLWGVDRVDKDGYQINNTPALNAGILKQFLSLLRNYKMPLIPSLHQGRQRPSMFLSVVEVCDCESCVSYKLAEE